MADGNSGSNMDFAVFNGSSTMATNESSSDYDYIDYTDVHFAPCEYKHHGSYFLPVLYSLFFVLGFLGNVFVVWVKIFGERIRTMTDVCLLNLALADLLLVCTLPFLAHEARDQWLFGDAMCKVVLGAYLIGFYCGIFFIILMSVDWYLAVVHVFSAPETRTRSVGMTVAAVIWFGGFLASFPELLFLQVQESPDSSKTLFCAPLYTSKNGTTPEWYKRHFWGVFGLFKMNILGLLIPMAIMGFCYTRIICELRLNQRTPMKQSAIRLVLVVVAAFFCCWTPYNVASFFKALELYGLYTKCDSSKAIKLTLEITEAIAYSHSCLNPLLYFCVGGRFRKNLLRLMNSAPCSLCQVMTTLIPPDRVTGPSNPQTPCVGDNCEDSIALRQIESINSIN